MCNGDGSISAEKIGEMFAKEHCRGIEYSYVYLAPVDVADNAELAYNDGRALVVLYNLLVT